ncbi:MAG: DUF86 domain-containing protein [Syntrophobacterales bacterium]|jgi:uncharacterized protein YutE (UPF0331/DUF86 family)
MNDLENSVLNRLFTEMDESLRKLISLSKLSEDEFLSHYEKVDTSKYNFIVAIEAIIDICNRIISKRKLGFPQDYSDVIKLMGQQGVLEGDLVGRLLEMVKFRNMLVHIYWKIENDRLYKYLKENLGDFEAFKEAIRKYLKKSPT